MFTAISLILVSISSVALWWGRRPEGLLGAPKPTLHPSGVTAGLVAIIVLMSIALPMLGTSITFVALTERFVLRRIPSVSRWLGLIPVPA